MDTIAEIEPHPVGTQVCKTFSGKTYRGQITRYDNNNELYWIDYKDGDHEELDWEQVEKYKNTALNPEIIKRFTRSNLKS